jgi:hypothetical protein
MWCVVVCDLKTPIMSRPWPTGGCRAKNVMFLIRLFDTTLSLCSAGTVLSGLIRVIAGCRVTIWSKQEAVLQYLKWCSTGVSCTECDV